MIEPTIGRMKIGDKLEFGAYGVFSDNAYPLMWLKATPNSDFITQDAVDYLAFDAREEGSNDFFCRQYGNANYPVSNILSFLNSDSESWFTPTHQFDSPPSRRGYRVQIGMTGYDAHPGFLYDFEDYEIDKIVQRTITHGECEIKTLVRLPSTNDTIGDSRFKLFSKRGLRAHPTRDLLESRSNTLRITETSFLEFWVSDPNDTQGSLASVISRQGLKRGLQPYCSAGVRPVCTLNPDTPVEQIGNGVFKIKPSESNRRTFTDEEFMELLGMAQP